MSAPAASSVFSGYTNPRSHFSRRLAVVQQAVGDALSAAAPGPVVVVDICSGVGNAILPVLDSHPRRDDVTACLLELDPESVRGARKTIDTLGLDRVNVVEADAGLSRAYVGLPRANILILSGVLAHLSDADRVALLAFISRLCAPDATLIWTIGSRWDPTRIRRVRGFVVLAGVTPLALRAVSRWRWGGGVKHEIGVGRVHSNPHGPEPGSGVRLFTFRLSFWQRHPRIQRLLRPVARFIRARFTRTLTTSPPA